MSARVTVHQELKAGLPGYRVYPYAVAPDGVEGVAVSIERATVARGATLGLWSEEINIYLLTSLESPERAEDDLDSALEAVLGLIEKNTMLVFTRAERSSIENHHGYIITVTVQTQIQEN